MPIKQESDFEEATRRSKESLDQKGWEQAGGAEPPTLARDKHLWHFRRLAVLWSGTRRWIIEGTFAPVWLPQRLRHPLVGYLAGILLPAIIAVLALFMAQRYPDAPHNIPFVLVVVVVALNWGVGSSLVATCVSTFLLYFVIYPYVAYPPRLAWAFAEEDIIGFALFILACLTISALASQSERARRRAVRLAHEREQARQEAEELAASLEQVQAHSEQERKRLQAVLDVLPVGVFIADADGHLLECNPAGRVIWGQNIPLADKIAQYGIYKAWRPGTGERVAPEEWALARTLLAGEEVLDEEVEIETFDGQHKIIANFTVPIRDEAHVITGGVVAVLDVTERNRLEEALRQSEREAAARASQVEAIFESMVDGVGVYDTDGHILRMNAAGLELLGADALSVEELRSAEDRAPYMLPHTEDGHPVPMEQWPLSRILRGETLAGASTQDVIFTNLRGRKVEANMAGAPVRDAKGHVIGAVMVLRDVTERRRLERRTREALNTLLAMGEVLVQVPDEQVVSGEGPGSAASLAAQRLIKLISNVLECPRVGISALDIERKTSQPLAVYGFAPEQEHQWWEGQRFSARWVDGSHPELITRLQAGETLVLDTREPPMRGEPNPYNMQIFLAVPMRVGERLVGLLILDPGSEVHRYTAEEIALAEATAKLGAMVIERERLLLEREAARATALAQEEANRQMDAFLSMVGHELKNPLAVIMLGLQLAQRRLQHPPPGGAGAAGELAEKHEAILEALARTDRQVLQLDRLVNDLLDVSRIQVGKLALHPEPVDLTAIVCQAVEEQRELAPTRAIHLSLPASPPLPPVCADAGRIGQVVTNYLSNALKYSTEDQPVEVGLERVGASARVRVRDYGPGLPSEEHERIWERFHRAPGIEVQSGSGVGLGMGLYICRTLIQRHRGQVGVQSAPGEGSTFWFTLPLASKVLPLE